MNEDTLSAVFAALPASATEVEESLGLTHEQTYAALIALESRGRAAIECDRNGSRFARVWRPLPGFSWGLST